MIKIDESKVNAMLDQHWDWFCKHVLSKNIKIEENGIEKAILCEKFINDYFGWDREKLKDIIKVQPNQLKEFANEDGDYYQEFIRGKDKVNHAKIKFLIETRENEGEKKKYKEIDTVFLDIFGYNDFKRGVKKKKNEDAWGAYVFTKNLGIDTCPYCNRQYIYTIDVGKKDSKDGRPDIDHFFPESEYPYLSCSLFNFIPSCHLCNHQKLDTFNKKIDQETKQKKKNLKPDGDYFRLLYPYQQGFSYPSRIAQFKLSIRKKEDPEYNEKKYKLEIVSKEDNEEEINKCINNSIEAFHLKDLYNLHQLELTELIEGCRDYSEAKAISLSTFLAKKLAKDEKFEDLVTMFEKKIKNIVFGIPRNTDKIYLLKQLKEDLLEQFEKEGYNVEKIPEN